VKAYASGQSGEGCAALEHFKRLFEAVLLEKVIVGTDIRSGRAGRHTGRHFRLSGVQPEHVEAARLEALAAACTFFVVDVTYQGKSSSLEKEK